MMRKHFGTDGVRGTVGHSPMTPDFVLRLGYAAGRVLSGQGQHPAVLIGKDTRISGYMIEAALEAGFSAAGVDVLLCGPLPTPGVAYLTRALRLSAGVVISASHNPYPDNGIKFFSGDGFKLPDGTEAAIEAEMDRPMGCNEAANLGRARRVDDAGGRYIEFCKSTFPAELDLKGMKIAIDCAHGAAYNIAPHVFHELGADVAAIGVKPDGFNINDAFGATSPQNLIADVSSQKAHLGIALDGDGDRVLIVDSAGRSYDGDQLLFAIARHRATRQKLGGVAGTLMTNFAFEKAMARLGIAFARAKVGDRYVLEELLARGAKLGGEQSGHIILPDISLAGDGMITAIELLRALRDSGLALEQLAAQMTRYPQLLVNIRVRSKAPFDTLPEVKAESQRVEHELHGRGRLLIRYSGTENLARVMIEGEDEIKVKEQANRLADAIRKAIGE